MNISNKAIVACIGCLTIGILSYLLNSGNCLWGLILIIFLVDNINN